MEQKIKFITTSTTAAILGTVSAWKGLLVVPVCLMAAANFVDYITGLMAAPHRKERVNSYKGFLGIKKKVSMWLLVVVGFIVDVILLYYSEYIGITLKVSFLVASAVALWITLNELISILENISDIGVPIPPFLMSLVKKIKKNVEEKGEEKQNGKDST